MSEVVEKGPMTKDALNHIVDTASQKGITLTCKEMKSALLYSDHKMYKKLKIGTDIGKLKILPTNGGKFYSSSYAGSGIEFPLPTETHIGTYPQLLKGLKWYTQGLSRGGGLEWYFFMLDPNPLMISDPST